jgi:hypothetical protein
LIGAFITRASSVQAAQYALDQAGVDLTSATVFAFLIFGANIPYWFSAMTMKSVGEAAKGMVKEVARQWAEIPGLRDTASMDFDARAQAVANGQTLAKPDYQKCVSMATNASLREMVPPAALVILAPIFTGILFGVEAVIGLLAGALASSLQLAISMSNTGGAWDNAKKYTEKGGLNGWFIFRDGNAVDEAAFKVAAAQYNGDKVLVVPGNGGKAPAAAPVNPMAYGNGSFYGGNNGPSALAGFPSDYSLPSSGTGMTAMPNMGYYGSQTGMYNMPGYPPMMQVQPMNMQVAGGNFGNEEKPQSFKDWLGDLNKSNPERYRKIMEGEEGVQTTDGRTVIYAGKKSKVHAAAVVGDTVGDPFKDTSGPALNIVMKLMAILSVVFCDFFMSINNGNGLFVSGELQS